MNSSNKCSGCLTTCEECMDRVKPRPRIDNIGQNGGEALHYDAVKKPKHYMLFPDLESIQGIQKILTEEEFRGFLKGNSLKYRFRAGKKDALEQDIAKAEQYEMMLEGLG